MLLYLAFSFSMPLVPHGQSSNTTFSAELAVFGLLIAPLTSIGGLMDLALLLCDVFQVGPLGRTHCMFVVPMGWVLATILLALHLRKRRAEYQPGLCGNCGYDLRHEHYQCPDCGSTRGTLAERAGKLPPA